MHYARHLTLSLVYTSAWGACYLLSRFQMRRLRLEHVKWHPKVHSRDAIPDLSDSKACVFATLLVFFLKLGPLEAPGRMKRRPELPHTHILILTRAAVLLSLLHTGHLPKPSLKQDFANSKNNNMVETTALHHPLWPRHLGISPTFPGILPHYLHCPRHHL